MGKYMRKCRGAAAGNKEAPGAVEVRAQVVVVGGGGVRTRSRSAGAVARGGNASKRRRKQQATAARVEVEEAMGREDGGAAASCYLNLWSRRLFIASAAAVVALRGPEGGEALAREETAVSGASSGDAAVGAISCYSSTALSADVAAARERSGGEAEAREGRDAESSISDSRCGGQERRETTPSSRTPVDSSNLESSQAVANEQKHQHRRYPDTPTTGAAFHLAARASMPPAAEIKEFFAAAEKAEVELFAAKYNFDVARGVPLDAGRFEWTPVVARTRLSNWKHAKREAGKRRRA